MEYVEGRPLSELDPSRTACPVEAVVRYGAQIADALEHAHARGVVHRDLKTPNVVVGANGRAKVLDFGLARRRAARTSPMPSTRSSDAVAPGGLAGTLPYMPPEVLLGEAGDERSDIWALGVMLFEMATGELPFKGRNDFDLTAAILRSPPQALPAHVPAMVRGVIQRCLAKDPGAPLSARRRSAGGARSDPVGRRGRRIGDCHRQVRGAVRWRWLAAPRRSSLVRAVGGIVWMPSRVGNPIWQTRANPRTSGAGRCRVGYADVRAGDLAGRQDARVTPPKMRTGSVDLYVRQVCRRRAGQADRRRARANGRRDSRPTASGSRSRAAALRGRSAGAAHRAVARRRSARDDPRRRRRGVVARRPAAGVHAPHRREATSSWRSRAPTDPMRVACCSRTARIRSSGSRRGRRTVANWRSSEAREASPARSGACPLRAARRAASSRMPRRSFADSPVFTPDGFGLIHSSNRGGATNLWAVSARRRADGSAHDRARAGYRADGHHAPDRSPSSIRAGAMRSSCTRWTADGARTLVTHSPFLWGPAFSPDGTRDRRQPQRGRWLLAHLVRAGQRRHAETPDGHRGRRSLSTLCARRRDRCSSTRWKTPRRIGRVGTTGRTSGAAVVRRRQRRVPGSSRPTGGRLVMTRTDKGRRAARTSLPSLQRRRRAPADERRPVRSRAGRRTVARSRSPAIALTAAASSWSLRMTDGRAG